MDKVDNVLDFYEHIKKHIIVKYLTVKDVAKLECVCKYLKNWIHSINYWKVCYYVIITSSLYYVITTSSSFLPFLKYAF